MSNEGILLDTAGRWTTEDDDQDEWLAFLDMLRRTRRGRALNGVLVSISAGDLLESAADDIPALAKKLRERVDEVMGRLECTLPVYLIITKCDLIGGFVETFGHLADKERGQIWGFTLPLDADGGSRLEMSAERLDRLVDVIEARSLKRLKGESRPEIRRQIFEFPQQFEELCPGLVDLVNDLFTVNAYHESPVLRGVYFTSATQEGRPIDRIVRRMAEAIGLAPAVDHQPVLKTKSYFLQDVFQHVVFPDQNVAGQGEHAVRRRRQIEMGAAGLAFVAAFGIALLPASAYSRNLMFARSVRVYAETLASNRGPHGGEQLPSSNLDELYETSQSIVLQRVEGPRREMKYGFYQGEKLYPFIARVTRDHVATPIVFRDVDVMSAFTRKKGQNFEDAIDALRLHLLLTGPKAADEPQPGSGAWEKSITEASALAVDRWKTHLHTTRAAPAPRSEHVIAASIELYLREAGASEHGQLWEPRNGEVVEKVRKALCTAVRKNPLEQILSDPSHDQVSITLSGIVGGSISLFKENPRIRGAFTRAGWPAVKARLDAQAGSLFEQGDWVLGGCETLSTAEISELRAQYIEGYAKEWTAFIEALELKPPRDFAETEQILRRYSEERPLPSLWQTLSENIPIELPRPSVVDAAVNTAVKNNPVTGKFKTFAQRFGNKTATQAMAAVGVHDGSDLKAMDKQFMPLINFGVSPKDGPSMLQRHAEHLRSVVAAFKVYGENKDLKPLRQEISRSSREVEDLLLRSGARAWEPVLRRLLVEPLAGMDQHIRSSEGVEANRRWCAAVVAVFQQSLADRYPFRADGADASMAMVEKFFQPQTGALWQFVKESLQADLEPQTFRPKPGAAVQYRPALTEYLRRAQAATDLLFYRGAPQLSIPVEARIWPAAGMDQISVRIGNQRAVHRNAAERFQSLTWPGQDAAIEVRGSRDYTLALPGEWGLFRLLDQAQIKRKEDRDLYLNATWTEITPGVPVMVDFKPSNLQSALRGLKPPTAVTAAHSPCGGS